MGRRPIVQGRAIDVTTSTSPLVGQHANCTVTDETNEIKGVFVRPEEIAEIGNPTPNSVGCASSSRARARPM